MVTNLSRSCFFFGMLATLALAGAATVGDQPAHAETTPHPCHLLTSAQNVPEGFGAAYNLFSAAKELLLNVTCDSSSSNATLNVGNGQNTTYIYRVGYEWTGSQWKQIAFGGKNLAGNDWYVGSADANISRSQTQLEQDNFVVAYTCLWLNNSWKCGCRDTACTQNYWQLQVFRQQSTDGGGGSGKFLYITGYTLSDDFPEIKYPKIFYWWLTNSDASKVDALQAKGHKVLNIFGVNTADRKIEGNESVQEVADRIIAMSDKAGADGILFDEFSLSTAGSPSNVDRFQLILKAMPKVRAARPNKLFFPSLTATKNWATDSNAKPLWDALANGTLDYAMPEVYADCDGTSSDNAKNTIDHWAQHKPQLIPKLVPIYGIGHGRPGCDHWTAAKLDDHMKYLLSKWLKHANPPPGLAFWEKSGGWDKDHDGFLNVINKNYGAYFE